VCLRACVPACTAGVEVIFTLLELKIQNPDSVFMSRGNHEDEVCCRALSPSC
jgi:hypothetical protein